MNAKQRRKEKRKNINKNFTEIRMDTVRKDSKWGYSTFIFSDTAPCIPSEYLKELFNNQKPLPDDIVKIMNDNMDELLKPIDF